MAATPEIPDPKKAQENKLSASFVWTPESTVSKAAASAAGTSARGRAPSSMQGRGKLALAAVVLLTGGLLFSFAAYRFAGTVDGSGGGTALGGVASSMKIRFARANDPTGYIMREKAKGNEKMRFDLIAGAADKAAAAKAAGGSGAPGEGGAPGENGDAPMNYEEGQASRAGAGGGASAGGAAGAGKDGEQGGAGGVAGGGSRLGSSYGSIKFQGMKRISSTAGFRGIQGRRGAPTRTISTKGSSSNSSAATRPDAASGGSSLAASGGKGSSAAGVASGKAAEGGATAGGSPDGGGGGGGDGGTFDTSGIENTQDTPSQVGDLLAGAKKDHERAEDEKKKAIALKALGQDPQAAYHYDRYKKADKSAKEKEAEANQLLATMQEAARDAATPQQPPP